jgi:DNA-binding MarR family transcriptional regulator/N-acetylglutamate synthase-like GNAT family acetyltransferase
MAPPERVAAVRAFNRFYTSRLGMVRTGLHRTDHPLAEARVLYEAGHGSTEVAELRQQLKIDPGHLSRLLTKLESGGLLTRERSPQDGRRQRVRLTPQGQKAFHTLDHRSAEEVDDLLDRLSEDDQRRLVKAMAEIDAVLEDKPPTTVIRGPRPGDLGWLVERHGAIYAEEYGWDTSFERLVAKIVADFDPGKDQAWFADYAGARAGCVLCVHKDETTAMLRTLLVEPFARGSGLGSQLVDEVIRYAKAQRYTTLSLWTNDVLAAARRVYERAGFTLDHQAPHHAFGHDLVEQTWSLNLSAWTETR